MSRSQWKNLKIIKNFFLDKSNSLKIWKRSNTITSSLVGKTVFVYNGKIFKKIMITREKIGYKYGEFSGTRNYKVAQKKIYKFAKKTK